MVRSVAVVAALCCLITLVRAETPVTGAAAPLPAPVSKAATGKPAPKSKSAAKRPAPPENGPCHIGVVSAIGDQFVVQEVGLTIFGNELTEVPIEAWGFDDLVVARIRAAVAPGVGVKKIAYPKGAFAPYDHPAPALFRNSADDLTAIVRQVAANAGCERYLAVTKFTGRVDGTNQTSRGIGVLRRGAKHFGYTSLFANFQVTVFDGKTFAIHNPPRDLGAVLAGTFARMTGDPLEKLDDDAFPEPAAEAANSAVLRDRMRMLLSARLDKTLPPFLKEE